MSAAVPDSGSFDRFSCCGVDIDGASLDQAVDATIERARKREGGAVHLCNAYTLSLAMRDPDLTSELNRGSFNFADGMPLVWVGRSRGHRAMTTRVYGPDLMEQVIDRGRAAGLKHYLYGSQPHVVEALVGAIESRFPGTDIVGAESPPFRPLTDEERSAVRARLADAGPHIVWVGLGTPRQDHFADEMAAPGGPLLVAVGAAFDFHSGNLKQAPVWMRRSGLEWLYRLYREPRRLWKRYLVGNSLFLYGVLRDLRR